MSIKRHLDIRVSLLCKRKDMPLKTWIEALRKDLDLEIAGVFEKNVAWGLKFFWLTMKYDDGDGGGKTQMHSLPCAGTFWCHLQSLFSA